MFDDLAAEILALDRRDLSCMTMLLFGGAATADEIAAALHLRRTAVSTTLARLQLAGYARLQPGEGSRIELTEHAREWIARIWSPVKAEGDRLLATYSLGQLEMFATFLGQACEVQDTQITQLRKNGWTPPRPHVAPIYAVVYRQPRCGACSCSSRRISRDRFTSTISPLARPSARITLRAHSRRRQA